MSIKDGVNDLILLEVASKPNIRVLTPPKSENDHAHDLDLTLVPKDVL